jgi:hypothetical protein
MGCGRDLRVPARPAIMSMEEVAETLIERQEGSGSERSTD